MVIRSTILILLTLVLAEGAVLHKPIDFVIDQSKPYVYVKFDHAGRRSPLSQQEPSTGLWLRLVNNSRVPITLAIFDAGKDNRGVGVYDEIVAVPPSGVGYVDASGVSHGFPVASGNVPKGYSLDEVSSSTSIAPGDSLLFSVPSNHVSESWYFRVEFQLEPPKQVSGPQPRSFVDFTWTMIPERDRVTNRR
jgi:hypothetical protein